ncbi:general stress protein [Brachybacterium sp. DNPG3]
MTAPHQQNSPLTARLYDLEYPRSLGVYSTYAEVQAVVDALADNQFPVQNTMIVGTDLKLIERVTGRKTWGRVIGQGVASGIWMGLFIGMILMFLNPAGSFVVVITSILMGIVFFTVWSVIGYAMTGGKRDFTSMTATIPMQYELMVEHTHAQEARRILTETGASFGRAPSGPAVLHGGAGTGPTAAGFPAAGAPPVVGAPSHPAAGAGTPSGAPSSSRPSYGQPAQPPAPAAPPAEPTRRPSYGQPAPQAPAPTAAPAYGEPAPAAPSYGEQYSRQYGAPAQPVAAASPASEAGSVQQTPQAPAPALADDAPASPEASSADDAGTQRPGS